MIKKLRTHFDLPTLAVREFGFLYVTVEIFDVEVEGRVLKLLSFKGATLVDSHIEGIESPVVIGYPKNPEDYVKVIDAGIMNLIQTFPRQGTLISVGLLMSKVRSHVLELYCEDIEKLVEQSTVII